jgi:hypothetical protein
MSMDECETLANRLLVTVNEYLDGRLARSGESPTDCYQETLGVLAEVIKGIANRSDEIIGQDQHYDEDAGRHIAADFMCDLSESLKLGLREADELRWVSRAFAEDDTKEFIADMRKLGIKRKRAKRHAGPSDEFIIQTSNVSMFKKREGVFAIELHLNSGDVLCVEAPIDKISPKLRDAHADG